MAYIIDSALAGVMPVDGLKKSVLRDIFPMFPPRVRTFYDMCGAEGTVAVSAVMFSSKVVWNVTDPEVAKCIAGILRGGVSSLDGVPKRTFNATRRALSRMEIWNVPPVDGRFCAGLGAGDFLFFYSPAVGRKGPGEVWKEAGDKAALQMMAKAAAAGAYFGAVMSAGRDGRPRRYLHEWCSSRGCRMERVGEISRFSRGKNIDDVVYITNVK